MKRILIIFLAVLSLNTYAGNADRIGENGAPELLMNGWARSTGLWDLNTSRVMGVEALRLNPAGLAHIGQMEGAISHTLWFQGMDVQMTQGAIAARMGKNAIGFSLMALHLGDFYRTTVDQPDANNGLGTFSPTVMNMSLGFAREFSNRIYGGAAFRLISEKTVDVNAMGFAFDAGLQYHLGKKEQVRFGISVRNLGTPMKFSGDGFSYRNDAPSPNGQTYQLTQAVNSNKFELPALLTIGASYDLWMGPEFVKNGGLQMHRLTMNAAFTSNSYGKDHFGGGVEYAFKEMFMVRGGYRYEEGIFDMEQRTSAYTGIAAGASINVPFKENGPAMGIDYSYRTSDPWGGTHSIGLRFGVPAKEKEEVEEGEDAFVKEVVKIDTVEIEKIVEVEKELKDSDGDGLPDIYDVCPNEAGDKEFGGCKPVELSKEEQAEIDRIAAGITFETGSSDLTETAQIELTELAEFMNARKKTNVIIGSHTDNVGAEDSNYALSEKRANSVEAFLISKGVDSSRITAEAYGETQPLAPNNTAAGRARNRRVELTIH